MPYDSTVPLRRGRSSSVVDEITGELRALILEGTLAPGSRLVELEIASRSSASQASVREALQRLESDGLVVRKGRKGTFVTDVSPEEMDELFLLRSLVETIAIRRAVANLRPEHIDELYALVERMRELARAGDTAALVEQDMSFHRRICTWADQPTLLRVWTLLCVQIERCLVMFDTLHFKDLTPIADSHLPIVAALEEGDADLAAERMEKHIRYPVHREPPR